MNTFIHLLPETITFRLGWTLVHFVWQGTAIAILTAIALTALRRRSANTRYLVSCAALLLMAASAGVTFSLLRFPQPPFGAPVYESSGVYAARAIDQSASAVMSTTDSPSPTPPLSHSTSDPPPFPPSTTAQTPFPLTTSVRTPFPPLARGGFGGVLHASAHRLEPYLPCLVAVWLIGMLGLSMRLLAGWVQVDRLRRQFVEPVSQRWHAAVEELSAQLRLSQPVRLLISTAARAPAAIGWLRPVILLPVTAMTGLTADQLRAVLAHELAHIRRYDYLLNILQSVIETFLFYHPAVWWISRRIRTEREHCCDDIAVAICGNPLVYARALAALEQLRAPNLHWATAATGGALLPRIQRLVGVRSGADKPTRWQAGLLAIAMTLAIAIGAHLAAFASAPTTPAANARNEDTAFKGVLPSGISIELLGISDGPTGQAGWWRPDGSKLASPPYQSSIPEPTRQTTGRQYQFAFRVVGGDGQDLRYNFADSRVAISVIGPKDARGEYLEDIGAVIALGPADFKGFTDVDVGIRVGKPQPVGTQRPGMMFPVTYEDGGVVFHNPRKTDAGFELDVAYTDHEPNRESYVVACDKAGKTYRANGATLAKAKGFVSATVTFKELPLENLDRVTLMTQTIEWAHFRNVALKPGAIGPNTQPAATQPSGNALRMRHFVRLVISKDRMTFQGKDITWDQLPALLKQVPNRPHTVLEFAAASDQVPQKELKEAELKALLLAKEFGFDYLSCIGEHPLGSMGSPSLRVPVEPEGSKPASTRPATQPAGAQTRESLEAARKRLLETPFPANAVPFKLPVSFPFFPVPAGKQITVTAHQGKLRWRTDGREILFDADRDNVHLIWNDGKANGEARAAVVEVPLEGDVQGKILRIDAVDGVLRFYGPHGMIDMEPVGDRIRMRSGEHPVEFEAMTLGMGFATQPSPSSRPADPLHQPPRASQPSERPADKQQTWSVEGRVTDGNGRPMAGVEIMALSGMGTLFRTGVTQSGPDGRYTLALGPGLLSFDKDTNTTSVFPQAAIIRPQREGFYEKDLSQGGNLVVAEAMPEDRDLTRIGREKVVLPNQPYHLDFVMLPAATIKGRLVDPAGKPLARRQVTITGPELPPARATLTDAQTDNDGKFEITSVPCKSWQFLIWKGPRTSPESRMFEFDEPGRYEAKLVLDENTGESGRLHANITKPGAQPSPSSRPAEPLLQPAPPTGSRPAATTTDPLEETEEFPILAPDAHALLTQAADMAKLRPESN